MSFDEILAICLEELEQGASVEVCLARYPRYAADLEPMLRLANQLSRVQPQQQSLTAFERGRQQLRAESRRQQVEQRPHHRQSVDRQSVDRQSVNQSPPTQQPAHKTPFPQPPTRQPITGRPVFVTAQHRTPASANAALNDRHGRTLAAPARLARWSNLLAMGVFLLAIYTVGWNVSTSLPGQMLYSVKRRAEDMQGTLLTLRGQRADWLVTRAERRLRELLQLEQQRLQIDPAFVQEAQEGVRVALEQGQSLTQNERQQLYAAWVDEMQTLGRGNRNGVAGRLVDQSIAQVQAAAVAEVAIALTPNGAVIVADTATVVPSPTPSPFDTPTTINTDTPLPTPAPLITFANPPLVAFATDTLPPPTPTNSGEQNNNGGQNPAGNNPASNNPSNGQTIPATDTPTQPPPPPPTATAIAPTPTWTPAGVLTQVPTVGITQSLAFTNLPGVNLGEALSPTATITATETVTPTEVGATPSITATAGTGTPPPATALGAPPTDVAQIRLTPTLQVSLTPTSDSTRTATPIPKKDDGESEGDVSPTETPTAEKQEVEATETPTPENVEG